MLLQVINGGKVCTENPIQSNRSSSQLHNIQDYTCPLEVVQRQSGYVLNKVDTRKC